MRGDGHIIYSFFYIHKVLCVLKNVMSMCHGDVAMYYDGDGSLFNIEIPPHTLEKRERDIY